MRMIRMEYPNATNSAPKFCILNFTFCISTVLSFVPFSSRLTDRARWFVVLWTPSKRIQLVPKSSPSPHRKRCGERPVDHHHKDERWRIHLEINPRPASASRALLRLNPCYRSYLRATEVALWVLPAPLAWRAIIFPKTGNWCSHRTDGFPVYGEL